MVHLHVSMDTPIKIYCLDYYLYFLLSLPKIVQNS